jgi:hypothetical protein
MIPLKQGPVTSRPGLEHIVSAGSGTYRIIPFVYSQGDSFVLVLGDETLGVYKDGVLQDTVVTPWDKDDLARLKYAQLGNVMTLCHPDYVPQELTRNSDTDWTIANLSFDASAFDDWSYDSDPVLMQWTMDANYPTETTDYPAYQWKWCVTAVVKRADGVIFETAPKEIEHIRQIVCVDGCTVWDPTATYGVDDAVRKDNISGTFWYCTQNHGAPGQDPEFSTGYWSVHTDGDVAYDSDLQTSISLGQSPGLRFVFPQASTSSDYSILYYRMYRRAAAGNGGSGDDSTNPVGYDSWGWIGDSEAEGDPPADYSASFAYERGDLCVYGGSEWICCRAATGVTPVENYGAGAGVEPYWRPFHYYPLQYFYDTNQTPDYTITPPSGENPFAVYDLSGTLTATENPAVVSYYEQRRIFGAPHSDTTGGRPGWLFASKTGDYSNFDRKLIQTSDDACEFELASMRFEEIRGLLPVSRLMVFTSENEWAVSGSGGALAFDSIDAKVQGNNGSAHLMPLQVGNEALFVQERGPNVLSVSYLDTTANYDATGLNIFADHFLDGYSIVAWTFTHKPHRCVWMVRSDGKLVSMTYQKEQEVNAWALHDTDGDVLDVCSIPEGSEDALYLLVERDSTTRLERMASFGIETRLDSLPLLDGHSLTNYEYPALTLTSGGAISAGSLVTLTAATDCWEACEAARSIDWRNDILYKALDWVRYGTRYYRADSDSPGEPHVGWTRFYEWSSGVTYSLGAYVFTLSGSTPTIYKCIVASSTNEAPSTHPSVWTSVAAAARRVTLSIATSTGTAVLDTGDSSTGRSSSTAMLFRVTSKTGTLTSGQALSSWSRTRTQADISGTQSEDNSIVIDNGGTVTISSISPEAIQVYATVTGTKIVSALLGNDYVQEVSFLPPASSSKEVRPLFCTLTRMFVEAIGYGGLQVGQDEDNMQSVSMTADSTDPLEMVEELVECRPANRWTKGAVGIVRQTLPYPLTILSVIREIEFRNP